MSEPAFMFPCLRALGEGRNLRRLAMVALRVEAVVTGVAGLFSLIELFRLGSGERTPPELAFPFIAACILLLAHLVIVVQVYWFRSNEVGELGESPFPALPIFAQLLRCTGEYLASSFVFTGLIVSLMIWSLGSRIFPGAPGGLLANPFVLGLAILFLALVLAFSFLMGSYLFADLLLATEDRNRSLRQLAFGGATGSAFAAAPRPGPAGTPCPRCQQQILPGSAFCDRCGQRLIP